MKNEQIKKMGTLTPEERVAAEAQFNAEKARLESEFNEKMLKNQREAAPSESANSPGKFGSTSELGASQKAIRLVPQGIAKQRTAVHSDAASLNEA